LVLHVSESQIDANVSSIPNGSEEPIATYQQSQHQVKGITNQELLLLARLHDLPTEYHAKGIQFSILLIQTE
jgi:hypothetical protein